MLVKKVQAGEVLAFAAAFRLSFDLNQIYGAKDWQVTVARGCLFSVMSLFFRLLIHLLVPLPSHVTSFDSQRLILLIL